MFLGMADDFSQENRDQDTSTFDNEYSNDVEYTSLRDNSNSNKRKYSRYYDKFLEFEYDVASGKKVYMMI
jgi:hypothetical protein